MYYMIELSFGIVFWNFYDKMLKKLKKFDNILLVNLVF